jgi:hypothetical protein
MADIKQLETALVNADRAGDTDAARMLAAEITRQRSAAPAAQASAAAPHMDPSEGGVNFRPLGIDTGIQMPQGVSRFLAGAGKAMTDVGRGTGQLIREGLDSVIPAERNIQSTIRGVPNQSFAERIGLPGRTDADYNQQLDKPLMNTGAGIGGNVAGGVAMALPAALAGPAGATIGAQAGIGALQGALQPVGTKDSRLQNIGVGGVAGAALPTAMRAAKVLKAGLVDPFTEAGRTRIVGGALNRAASDPVEAAANLEMVRGATPGFNPTAGQASNDAGIASVERAARAIDPAGFGDVDSTQRAALVNALRSVAKTPEDRAAAVGARDDAAKSLYGRAFDSDKMRQSLAQDAAAQRAPFSGVGLSQPAEDLATPGLRELVKRPIVKDAAAQAKAMAANFGVQLDDPLQSLQGLHYIKLALDDMAQPSAANALGRNANAAVNNTREALTKELEKVAPLYGNARQTFADMSKPINQMDIGQELTNRFVPPLADGMAVPFSSRAASLAGALRNGDKLAQNVTGLKGATMGGVMEPGQMDLLRGVVSDSQMKAAAETAGRGVGSDTVQKMAMSNLIDQAGLPSWIGALAPLRSVGGMARTAGDFLMTKNDETMRHLLADVLKDPARAAGAMKKAGVSPTKFAEYLKQAGAAANPAVPAAALASD